MTIQDIINLNIFDENETILILDGENLEHPHIVEHCLLCELTENTKNRVVENIGALGENRAKRLNISRKYGCMEIWII